MEQKYRAELRKSGWWVIGPKTELGPYSNQFRTSKLVEELNLNHEIGQAIKKQKQGNR